MRPSVDNPAAVGGRDRPDDADGIGRIEVVEHGSEPGRLDRIPGGLQHHLPGSIGDALATGQRLEVRYLPGREDRCWRRSTLVTQHAQSSATRARRRTERAPQNPIRIGAFGTQAALHLHSNREGSGLPDRDRIAESVARIDTRDSAVLAEVACRSRGPSGARSDETRGGLNQACRWTGTRACNQAQRCSPAGRHSASGEPPFEVSL
jgi:hypothetical protein